MPNKNGFKLPTTRKSARLQFQAARRGSAWYVVDVDTLTMAGDPTSFEVARAEAHSRNLAALLNIH